MLKGKTISYFWIKRPYFLLFTKKYVHASKKCTFEGKINEIFYFKNPHTTFLVLGPFVMVLKIGLPTQKIEQSAYIALQQKVLVFTKVLFD